MCGEGPRILIIDDEQIVRDTISDFLEDYEYGVMTAVDGKAGLELFKKERPDAVIVDLTMPEVDGFQVLQQVTAIEPEVPVIVVSGVGIISEAMRAVRLGAWDFLPKPIEDMEFLQHTLQRAFERARLLRENREYKEQLEEKVARRTSQLQDANDDLRKAKLQIIQRLGRAAEYKDNETGHHVIRVSMYCEILGHAMGMAEDDVEMLKNCAPMHDIGKIGIPDDILLKPGPLDDDEWETMKRHCEYGCDILGSARPGLSEQCVLYPFVKNPDDEDSDSQTLDVARTIALLHHERWDGTGYPIGLEGETIPIEARITSVADVYDALGSDRTYKKAFPEEKCQGIIREMSGTHFDPRIVDAFFDNIDEIVRVKNEWGD